MSMHKIASILVKRNPSISALLIIEIVFAFTIYMLVFSSIQYQTTSLTRIIDSGYSNCYLIAPSIGDSMAQYNRYQWLNNVEKCISSSSGVEWYGDVESYELAISDKLITLYSMNINMVKSLGPKTFNGWFSIKNDDNCIQVLCPSESNYVVGDIVETIGNKREPIYLEVVGLYKSNDLTPTLNVGSNFIPATDVLFQRLVGDNVYITASNFISDENASLLTAPMHSRDIYIKYIDGTEYSDISNSIDKISMYGYVYPIKELVQKSWQVYYYSIRQSIPQIISLMLVLIVGMGSVLSLLIIKNISLYRVMRMCGCTIRRIRYYAFIQIITLMTLAYSVSLLLVNIIYRCFPQGVMSAMIFNEVTVVSSFLVLVLVATSSLLAPLHVINRKLNNARILS
jgi:hypothetical protein